MSELRTDIGDVIIKPVLPEPGEALRIQIQQPGYTLEVPIYDAENIAITILMCVEKCRAFSQGEAREASEAEAAEPG